MPDGASSGCRTAAYDDGGDGRGGDRDQRTEDDRRALSGQQQVQLGAERDRGDGDAELGGRDRAQWDPLAGEPHRGVAGDGGGAQGCAEQDELWVRSQLAEVEAGAYPDEEQ